MRCIYKTDIRKAVDKAIDSSNFYDIHDDRSQILSRIILEYDEFYALTAALDRDDIHYQRADNNNPDMCGRIVYRGIDIVDPSWEE